MDLISVFLLCFVFYYGEASDCGGVLVENSGVVTSPSYPNPHPSNSDCIWTVSVAHNRVIRMTFEDFDIEDDATVEVYDIRNIAPFKVQYFQGSGIIHSFDALRLSTYNQMEIRMTTGPKSGRKGFKLSYTSVIRCPELPASCHGDMHYATGLAGDVASLIECDPGYTPIGPKQKYCGCDGQWTPSTQFSCQMFRTSCDIPRQAVFLDNALLDMAFYRLTSRVNRVTALLSLPDGGVLVAVQDISRNPQQNVFYLVKQDGTVTELYSCSLNDCASFGSLSRHNDIVYGLNGKIYQFHLSPSRLELIDIYETRDAYRGAYLAKNLLVTAEYHNGNLLTFNLLNRHKEVKVTQLRKPSHVAVKGEGNNAIIAVCEHDGHQIKLYDSSFTLIRSIGQEGRGNGQLWFPNQVIFVGDRLLVADSTYRVSEFTIQGVFVRNWLNRPDLYFNGLSFCYPYLWLEGRLNPNGGVLHALRFNVFQQ